MQYFLEHKSHSFSGSRDVPAQLSDWKLIMEFQTLSELDVASGSGIGYLFIIIISATKFKLINTDKNSTRSLHIMNVSTYVIAVKCSRNRAVIWAGGAQKQFFKVGKIFKGFFLLYYPFLAAAAYTPEWLVMQKIQYILQQN